MDVPQAEPEVPTNLELVFYLLNATEANGKGDYPELLAPAVKQLEKTFQASRAWMEAQVPIMSTMQSQVPIILTTRVPWAVKV